MLDRDLARLYQVEVKVLNQAVKRNSSRFPADFMFQLTAVEAGYLRSQSVTLDGVEAAASSVQGRGKHLKYRPYAFTEQGVAMLSSVLRSDRAVTVNIEIMRAFVRLRAIVRRARPRPRIPIVFPVRSLSCFIFEVSDEEVRNLMSQFATSSGGGTRKRPCADEPPEGHPFPD